MPDIPSVLLNLGAGVLTGTVTAAVSVRFALSRFRAERTWERKIASYTEIFDSLYNIRRYAKMLLREMEEGATFGKEYKEQANRLANEGYDSVRRAAIKGTFVVGPKAAAKLEQLVGVFDDPHYGDDFHDEISDDLSAAEQALVELRMIANVDVYDSELFGPRRIREYFFGKFVPRRALAETSVPPAHT